MANTNQRPAAVPQRQSSRAGVNTRPGLPFVSGWGARILAFVVLGIICGVANYFGLDEDSSFPEEGAYVIMGISVLLYVVLFVQQLKAKYVLFADRLEAWGMGGKKWDVTLSQIEGIRFDPTQGNFPLGKAIVIYDRQQRMLVVPRSVSNVKDLATRLTLAHSEAVLPDILLRLEGSDDIRFGDDITVNRDMIIAPDPATRTPTQFGLRDFQQAFMKSGELTMNMSGKQPLKLKLTDVLNAHMLMTVIMKAKALGPRIEIVIPVNHDALERTDQMEKLKIDD